MDNHNQADTLEDEARETLLRIIPFATGANKLARTARYLRDGTASPTHSDIGRACKLAAKVEKKIDEAHDALRELAPLALSIRDHYDA